jgi:hypothetical protein
MSGALKLDSKNGCDFLEYYDTSEKEWNMNN